MYRIIGSGDGMKTVSVDRKTPMMAIKCKKLMASCGYTTVMIVIVA
jgi:hypothetical protein